MAQMTGQPAVAGKHPMDLSMFRGSSQDGQYMPWDMDGSPTLKMGSHENLEGDAAAPCFGVPETQAPPGPTSPPGYVMKVPPSSVAPSPPEHLTVPPVGKEGKPEPAVHSKPHPALTTPASKKGWVDHTPKKAPASPGSVPKMHL